MKKTKGFGLLGIIIIMIITAVVSSIATGVIMLNNEETNIGSVSNDKELQEFIDVYETLLDRYYNDIDKKGMLDAAEEGMLNFLGDKYTTYLNDDEYQDIMDELASTYNGIGIEIMGNLIVNVTADSPAEEAGIKSGDIINKINGINVTEMDSSDISTLIKKDASNSVDVELIRGEETLVFTVNKTDLINKSVEKTVIEGTNIGYIQLTKFAENLSDQVEDALTDLENKGINALIIDVRNNTGGYLSAAEETASLFLEEGKKIYSLKTSDNEYTYKDKTKEKRDYPIVVLINGNSASASEILAAALKMSYNATLVGTKSYGKGKVQQIVHSAKYTSAKWLTPNGDCIDGVGIYPDQTVSNIEGDSTDYQLNKAIEILS